MNSDFTAEEEAFRRDVRTFLEDWRDLDGYFQQGRKWLEVRTLFQALGARGWLALTWPESEGGLGRSAAFEYLLWDEAAHARAARNPLSAGIVARTLIRVGTPEQKARWLPPIRSGDLHFSLAYSEPEAGSDLASLRTRAALRGDRYVVDGQKCWQSYAQDADAFWLLARTGAPDSRGHGLSLFIVDVDAPGVQVSALPTLDGDQLNEVRFDAVEVSLENRVGPEDGAWTIMAEALADERHIQFPAGRLRRDLEEIAAFARSLGKSGDPLVRRRLADLAVEVREADALAKRVLDAVLHGRPAVVEAAANKVFHTVLCQKLAAAAFEIGGVEALPDASRANLLWRQSTWETIGGGTSEVMRGVVARHGLGLGGRR
jgi:alkylation response protein AidB-like acyl-CoA dehydrogenase